MARILIIEDDSDIAALLRRGLTTAGHSVHHADSHAGTRAALAAQPFDAAIIDMMLGEESGAEILTDLRGQGYSMPALMLSALSRVEERALGLNAGAQDYIVKPFQFSELLARLEVQLHRHVPADAPLSLAGLAWDPAARLVRGAGRDIALTEREGELLAYLMRSKGALRTRGQIFDALWAPHGGSTDNVVDVYIGYLRRKLGNFTGYGLELRTLRGRGFVLAPVSQIEEETEE